MSSFSNSLTKAVVPTNVLLPIPNQVAVVGADPNIRNHARGELLDLSLELLGSPFMTWGHCTCLPSFPTLLYVADVVRDFSVASHGFQKCFMNGSISFEATTEPVLSFLIRDL